MTAMVVDALALHPPGMPLYAYFLWEMTAVVVDALALHPPYMMF
jgi:hypothetical protein